jgi:ABC-type Na+ efflux pump permease subunit
MPGPSSAKRLHFYKTGAAVKEFMSGIEALRAERYNIAKSIFADTFGSPREQKLMEAVMVETGRIAELESQYAEANASASALLAKAEQNVAKTEEAAQQAAKEVGALQAAIDGYKRTRTRQKGTADTDAQRDSSTYATATTLLDERVAQAQHRLEELQSIIESYEPKPFLKNPQAQELYLQLRSLLSAQEKELRALLRPFSRTI